MKGYHGKNIWIIGASSGIGRALALELANRGAILALSARNTDALDQLNSQLQGQHHVFPVDVTDINAMIDISHEIDVLFPNLDSVILMAADYTPMKLDGLDMEKVRQMIDVNLSGTFNLVHSVLPVLTSQKKGQLVLCGSVSGYRGLPNGQPYSATKAAIINLAESLRAEKASEGIDVKVINPGFVRTSLTDKNNFTMPMMIEPETAARIIADQLQSNRFEIHFPKKFSWLMKVLRILPDSMYFYIVQKIKR